MKKYELTDDLKTGNELIDNEHQTILDEVNKLLEACSQGKGRQQISHLGDFLVEYVNKHFADEEELQKKTKYPDYEEHRKFHEWYKQKLGDTIIKLEQEGASITSLGEINHSVEILVKHIREMDRKMAAWVRKENPAGNTATPAASAPASKAVSAPSASTASAAASASASSVTRTAHFSAGKAGDMDFERIIDMQELQKLQDLFSAATGMTAAVVDLHGNYVTKGKAFSNFEERYSNGKHSELREFTRELTLGGFQAGSVIGGVVVSDFPNGSAPTQERVDAAGDLLAEMLNGWGESLYSQKSSSDNVENFAKEEKKVREAISQIRYKAKGLEQTATMEKMLSLNAAIEAGRAGKAGVGFGVVAEEIGRMANESAAVYKEIQDLVKQVEESMERMGK